MKNLKYQFQRNLFLLFMVVLPQITQADVSLNAVFSDHMVLQRESNVHFWGWADPQERIIIHASWGAQVEAITDANGTWKVKLKTPKAGGPFQITIRGKNTIVLNDVLSGEVWLCTGQSNMV